MIIRPPLLALRSYALGIIVDTNGVPVDISKLTPPFSWKKSPVAGTIGTDLVFEWQQGQAPYNVVVNNPAGTQKDNLDTSTTSYTVKTTSADADGDYVIVVTDLAGATLSTKFHMTKVAAKTATGHGDVSGKAGGDVIPLADLVTLAGGAVDTDITDITDAGGKATYSTANKELTLANDASGDIDLTIKAKTGVAVQGTLTLKGVTPKP